MTRRAAMPLDRPGRPSGAANRFPFALSSATEVPQTLWALSPASGRPTEGFEVRRNPCGPCFWLRRGQTLAKRASRTARELRSAMARWPFHARQPGKTRQAGPGRLCGAPRDRGESCALGAHLGGFARGKNKGNYFGPGEAGLAPYRGQSGAFHFSAAGPNFPRSFCSV